MQTKTHLALGHYLLSVEKDAGLHRHSGFSCLDVWNRITIWQPTCAGANAHVP